MPPATRHRGESRPVPEGVAARLSVCAFSQAAATRRAEISLAVLELRAAASEARLEQPFHALRAFDRPLHLRQLAFGERPPALGGRRVRGESGEEGARLADRESRIER